MADRTREARKPSSPPSASDIHELLAAINKIEKRDRSQVHAKEPQLITEPLNPPTYRPSRLVEVLDSVASLCVSKQRHEVIAVALRNHPSRQSVELIIAGNEDLPEATITHLNKVWGLLKEITALHDELDPRPMGDNNSPTKYPNDPRYTRLRNRLYQSCMDFTFERFKYRVNSKYPRLTAVDTTGLHPSHSFFKMRSGIAALERVYTRKRGARIGRPSLDDEKGWKLLFAGVRVIRRNINDFLKSQESHDQNQTRVSDLVQFKKINDYLRKINSLPNSIDILLKTAASPQCRDLFKGNLILTPLKKMSSKAPDVPRRPEDWERILEEALGRVNSRCLYLDLDVIERDTAYMAGSPINPDLVVHCEVKLLWEIFRAEQKDQQLPKAYTYLGVSKLSCYGCASFIDGFNGVHKTHFMTRGSHEKSYYPWQFPSGDFSKRDELIEATYKLISDSWVDSYTGYRPKFVSDSTAQSGRTMGHDVDSDEEQMFASLEEMADIPDAA